MLTNLGLLVRVAPIVFLNVFALGVLLPPSFLVVPSNGQSRQRTTNRIIPFLLPSLLAITVNEILVRLFQIGNGGFIRFVVAGNAVSF